MASYTYKAKTKEGELLEGQIEAESPSSVAKALLAKEVFPISIQEVGAKKFLGISLALKRVTLKDKSFFARQFSILIKAGLPVTQSLSTIADHIKNAYFRNVIRQILADVEGGTALSKSMVKFPKIFPPIHISLVEAGEASGTLDQVFERLANQLERDMGLLRKIKAAMYYPAFVLGAVFILLYVIMTYVVPKMTELYAEFKAELPFLTRIVIGISKFMASFWWLFPVFVIAFIFGFRAFVGTEWGRRAWDKFKIKVPVFGKLFQEIYLARFTRTLMTLVSSGVSIIEALKIVADGVGNVWYREAILGLAGKVQGGVLLSKGIQENPIFPDLLSLMVKVGEESGELDTMLNNLANFYEDEVDYTVKGITALMEPALMVVVGILVGGVLIAVIMPVYSLVSQIGGAK